MRLNNSSDIIFFDNYPVSRAVQIGFNAPRQSKDLMRNVVLIGDKFYYAKSCSSNSLINELIGSYLANLIGLDSVDYRIGQTHGSPQNLYALSEIFFQDECEYFTPEDVLGIKPDDSKVYRKGFHSAFINETTVLDTVSSFQIVDSVLKMTALDLKTGQSDRFNYNVMLRRMYDTMEMEKLYDYGASYQEDIGYARYNCYYNPFLIVKRNTISLIGLSYKYPELAKSAAILSNIPLYDVLKDIEKRFNIKIDGCDIPGYMELDKKYCKILRMVR